MFPCYRDKPITAPSFIGSTWTILEPAFPYRWLRYSTGMVHGVWNRTEHGRRIGIVRKGLYVKEASLVDDRNKDAPVGTVESQMWRFTTLAHSNPFYGLLPDFSS